MYSYSPGPNAYCKYYQSQLGGSANFPVFVGGQHGDGIGSFFRSVWRFIAPIALRGISNFAANTLQKHEQGASLKDAAKSSIMPALSAMASGVTSSQAQSGSGGVSPLFSGVNGIPMGAKRVYKSLAFKSKKRPSKKRRKLDHANYNF
jgi:hypothetical protein